MKCFFPIFKTFFLSTLLATSVAAHAANQDKPTKSEVLEKYNKAAEELLKGETPETSVNIPDNQQPIQYKADILELDNVDIILLYHLISGDKKFNIRSIAAAGRVAPGLIPTPFSKICDALIKAWQENDEFAINDNTHYLKKHLAEKSQRLQNGFYFSLTIRSTAKSLTYNFNDHEFQNVASFNGEVNTAEHAMVVPAKCVPYTSDQNICVHAINFEEAKKVPVAIDLARNIHNIQKLGKVSIRYIFKIERKVSTFRPGVNEVEHSTVRAKIVRVDILNAADNSMLYSYKLPVKKEIPDAK